MAKAKQTQQKAPNAFIPLVDIAGLMGKFSNNLVMQANEDDPDDDGEEVGVWTFPWSGILLNAEHINQLYQDEYTHRCWFQTKKGVVTPMPWVTRLPPPIPFGLKFENVALQIAYAESPNRNTARDKFDGCKIGRILFYPQGTSGEVEMRCHIQIKPGMGEPNRRLQEYQNRRVALTVFSADVAAAKDSKQQSLALGAPEAAKDGAEGAGAGFAEAAKAHVEGWKNRKRNQGEPADAEEGDGASTH